jgi:hypothetical protein
VRIQYIDDALAFGFAGKDKALDGAIAMELVKNAMHARICKK